MPLTVTLFRVIRPLLFSTNPLTNTKFCLSNIPANMLQLGLCSCGSFLMNSGPNLLLASI